MSWGERDWSQLPNEILIEISKHIHARFELLHFRSVCQSWRSSSPIRSPFNPAIPVPLMSEDDKIHFSPGICKLVESTVYKIRPNESESKTSWLIKVEEEDPNTTHLFYPFSTPPSPTSSFPKVEFNLLDFNVNSLCKQHLLVPVDSDYKFFRCQTCIPWFRVVSSSVATNTDFVIMGIPWSEKQVGFFRNGNENWSGIGIEDVNCDFNDIMNYKGRFYAVDNTGRTCVCDPLTLKSIRVANPILGGEYDQQKRFIESDGELFLIDYYIEDEYDYTKFVGFKVFKLDEEKQEWIGVDSLGVRVFYLDDQCSFSISALDFNICKGNCILLVTRYVVGVLDLDDHIFKELASDSRYFKLFWPPQNSTPASNPH